MKPIVAVVGTGSEKKSAISDAFELGKLLAKEGYIVISGGRDAGVMRAVNRGAKTVKGSLTIGLLPTASASVAPEVDVALNTDMNNARNNLVGLSASVVVACGVDGPGTASELALALKNQKSIILLNADTTAVVFFTKIGGKRVFSVATPQDAIKTIKTQRLC
jgi:uncharacterized protein (TIGR00725 family)